MTIITITYAKTHFSTMMKQVEDGHSFIITRYGKPIARILPFDY
jgi:prevent-host-death family protein